MVLGPVGSGSSHPSALQFNLLLDSIRNYLETDERLLVDWTFPMQGRHSRTSGRTRVSRHLFKKIGMHLKFLILKWSSFSDGSSLYVNRTSEVSSGSKFLTLRSALTSPWVTKSMLCLRAVNSICHNPRTPLAWVNGCQSGLARIRNKFHILRKQLWLGCCENWSLGWRAQRTHSSLAGGVLPWEAITAGCQLTASFQSESGLAWSSGTL